MVYTLTAWLLFQDVHWPAYVEHFQSLEACNARQDEWSERARAFYARQPGLLRAFTAFSVCDSGSEPAKRPL